MPNQSNNHYLQSEQWSLGRQGSPWKDTIVDFKGESLRIYARLSPIGLIAHVVGYSPQPDEVTDFTKLIKSHYSEAVTCKLETCTPYDEALVDALKAEKWIRARTTQYAYTVQLDLTKGHEKLKAELKKRARNEINRAINNNVSVVEQQPTDDNLEIMYGLLTRTASRKQFSVHDRHFTFTYWRAMIDAGMLRLFFAVHEGEVLAAAVILTSKDGKKAWYKEGASTTDKSGLNAPRYLLWEIILQLEASKVQTFDLGGIPDPATYEVSRMRGLYIFKTAFTNDVTKMMPAFELPIKPARYKVWPKAELALRKYAQKRNTNWY